MEELHACSQFSSHTLGFLGILCCLGISLHRGQKQWSLWVVWGGWGPGSNQQLYWQFRVMLILVTEAKLTPGKTFPQNSNELFLNVRGDSKFWNIFGEVGESVFPGNFWSNSITMVKSVDLAPALISCCRYNESPHAQRFTIITDPLSCPSGLQMF